MLDIRRCETLADFEAAHGMLAEMGVWDAGEASAYGVPIADTLATYYGDQPATLLADFTAPGHRFFLARWNGEAAGCAGFARWDEGVAELKKLYVRPALRGKGIARALLDTALSGMRDADYAEARLVTTRFMSEAVALYGRFGFEPCPAFEPLPEAFAPFTLFMKRRL